MQPFYWSFIQSVVDFTPRRNLSGIASFGAGIAKDFSSSRNHENIPEGFLIEACAQASGMAFVLGDDTPLSLPLLSRVNQADFSGRPAWEMPLNVDIEIIHQSESAAECECELGILSGTESIVKCNILMGLVPFSLLPDQGRFAIERLKVLKTHVESIDNS